MTHKQKFTILIIVLTVYAFGAVFYNTLESQALERQHLYSVLESQAKSDAEQWRKYGNMDMVTFYARQEGVIFCEDGTPINFYTNRSDYE